MAETISFSELKEIYNRDDPCVWLEKHCPEGGWRCPLTKEEKKEIFNKMPAYKPYTFSGDCVSIYLYESSPYRVWSCAPKLRKKENKNGKSSIK